jgi:hypothetical protein
MLNWLGARFEFLKLTKLIEFSKFIEKLFCY